VARNAAAAWADQCQGCFGRAVALQIVVARSAEAVRADNRAFAASAACVGCDVAALALQFVVVDRRGDRPSLHTLAAIEELANALATHTPAASPALGAGPAAARTPTGSPAGGDVGVAARSTGTEVAGLLRADLTAPVTMSVRVGGG
jgi:hypothetical protein